MSLGKSLTPTWPLKLTGCASVHQCVKMCVLNRSLSVKCFGPSREVEKSYTYICFLPLLYQCSLEKVVIIFKHLFAKCLHLIEHDG